MLVGTLMLILDNTTNLINLFKNKQGKDCIMDNYTACSIVEGFDGEEHTESEVINAWQSLINTGICWKLQGWYGRMAQNLIDGGICLPV